MAGNKKKLAEMFKIKNAKGADKTSKKRMDG